MSETIVFIHGAWLASNSWDPFAAFFADRGYATLAPEWPRKPGDIERSATAPTTLAGLGVAEIVDHYTAIIEALDEPPILIGHSFGGLFVQILLGRGLGRAGVALDPGRAQGRPAHRGVQPEGRRAGDRAPVQAPRRRRRSTFEQFHYAFTNTWSRGRRARRLRRATRCRRPGGILFEDGLANFTLHGRDRGRLRPRRARRRC